MVQSVLEHKLEALRHCVERVQARCPPDLAGLLESEDLQDIVCFNLTRAVQLCVDIASHVIARSHMSPSDTMGQAFDDLARLGVIDGPLAGALRKAVAFRNIAVHGYGRLDWAIVHDIATQRTGTFREFARRIATHFGLDQGCGDRGGQRP